MKYRLIAFVLLIFTLNLFAQDKVENNEILQFSLIQAREYALEHNINVLNSKLDYDIAKGKVWETTAIGLPQVNSSIAYNNYLDIATQLLPGEIFGMPGSQIEVQFGTKHNANIGITASQLIFSGEYIVGLQAASIYKKLSEQNISKSKYDVTELVTRTYYLVLMANENKKIVEASLKNTLSILEEMRKTHELGFIESSDVDQLELTYQNLQNTISTIDRQIELTYNMLKIQLGVKNNQQIELTDNIQDLLNTIDIDNLISQNFVLEDNIDYRLLSTQKALSKLELKRQKSTFLPTLSAFFTHQQNAMRNEFSFFNSGEKWFPTTIIGMSINIPIFGSGMKLSKVQQAKLTLLKTQNTLGQVAENLELGIMQAKSDMSTAHDKYLNEKANLELSEKIYNNYLIKFKKGLASSIELTQTQNQNLSTQSNYISAMIEMLNAKNALDKAMGNY